VVGGHPKPHIWNKRPQFAYSLYNFYGATTTIKGSLHGSPLIAKRLSVENFLVKIGLKMAAFWELRGVNVKFLFSNPEKAHPCAEPRRLTYYAWKSVRGLGCGALEELGKKKPSKHLWCAISLIRRKETAWGIVTNFCIWVDIQDNHVCNFCDDRLRGLGVARGRISRFPIDLRRRPYNTLALPCDRVIWPNWVRFSSSPQSTITNYCFI